MTKHLSASRSYIGYREEDHSSPFSPYYDPMMAPLPSHVVEALNLGPRAVPLLTSIEKAGDLLSSDSVAVETGYTLLPDGSMTVAVLTHMPDVTPAMWDWWFTWHGDDTRKYKLWHPQAHVAVQWSDTKHTPGPRSYIGRTSFVEEYLGHRLTRAAIRFLPPSELGLDEDEIADPQQATVICARVGFSCHPLDAGYLLHHVRKTHDGSEMRSRFWIGGRHAALRTRSKALNRALPSLTTMAMPMTAQRASELLVHCAQEMAHLAVILPSLHATFACAENQTPFSVSDGATSL
ncbi:DAPG hydrolase family protein [Streptomyces sp. NPDC127084]|uniref:DAPG hydrolase family protein n=1 Tax=Streptomyces sp. NPDC127084 TaxID=3347133 RepID=UPI00365B778C